MKKVIVTLTDDLDGSEAAETLAFTLDGITYEIDLSESHANGLREFLAPFATAGRTVRPGRVIPGRKRGPRASTADVRAWAAENGYRVSNRGRIPASILAEYESAKPANPGPQEPAGARSGPGPGNGTASASGAAPGRSGPRIGGPIGSGWDMPPGGPQDDSQGMVSGPGPGPAAEPQEPAPGRALRPPARRRAPRTGAGS